jgi:glycosyltransferase involved in cell wall biosynthesis
MHIAMILSTPLPAREGIGFYAWNLSRFLIKQGHHVTLITRRMKGDFEREILDGIEIWRPPFLPIYPFHAHFHGMFVDRLIGGLEESLDILHLHSPLLKKPASRLPQLVTIHSGLKADIRAVSANSLLGGLIKLQAPISYRLEADLFTKSHKLVAVATSIATEMQEYGFSPDQIAVLGNGVDTSMFTAVNGGRRKGTPYALSVARLAPRKGLKDLLDCAEYVAKRYPSFQFKIAGDGPMYSDLKTSILRRGLEDTVILLGHVGERQRLVELYQGASIFVHPAHYEGLPTVLLEAMACSLPVVATAVSGALDAVQNGENGYLVPVRAPEEMGEAICQIIENPQTGKRLGEAAREKIERCYSWEIVSQEYIDQYEQLLMRNYGS